jgi:GrpB-like predicted nucleotidyltransferase (UPF0157 family)
LEGALSKYVFKPYSKIFPDLFIAEKNRIFSAIGDDVQIEHIGSTAVPGLGGKDIIDIAISSEKKDQILLKIRELGYGFYPEFSTENRLFFKTDRPDPEETRRTYHIHLMAPQSEELKDMLFFREYLKSHPEQAKIYAEIKKRASVEAHEDGNLYRKLKEPFMKEILKKRSR